MFTKLKTFAVAVVAFVTASAGKLPGLLKQIPGLISEVQGSAQGIVVVGEVKRAIALAVAAGTVGGGSIAFISYLSSDQTFVAAVVPFVAAIAAKVGLVLPDATVASVVSYALTLTVAIVGYLRSGTAAPAGLIGAALPHKDPVARVIQATGPLAPCVEVVVPSDQDLDDVMAKINDRYRYPVTRVRTPFGDNVVVACDSQHGPTPGELATSIEADFPGLKAKGYA